MMGGAAKTAVFLAIIVLIAGMPLFLFYLLKMVLDFSRMIAGIRRDVYSSGLFLLGPLLLVDARYFDAAGREGRIQLFRHLRITAFLFVLLVIAFAAVRVIPKLGL